MRSSTILSAAVLAGAISLSLAAPVAPSSYVAKRAPLSEDLDLVARRVTMDHVSNGASIVSSVVSTAHQIYDWIKGKRSVDELEQIFARSNPEAIELFARTGRLQNAATGIGAISSLVSTAHEIYNWIKGKRSFDELDDILARAEPELNEIFARRVTLDHVANGAGIVSSVVSTAHQIYDWIKGKRSVDELEQIFARAEVTELFARTGRLANAATGIGAVSSLVSTAHEIYNWIKGKRSEDELHAILARADPEVLDLFARAGGPEQLELLSRAVTMGHVADGVNIASTLVHTAHEIYDWIKNKREVDEMFARSYGDLYAREYAARSLYDLD